jgi:hypothetical protein
LLPHTKGNATLLSPVRWINEKMGLGTDFEFLKKKNTIPVGGIHLEWFFNFLRTETGNGRTDPYIKGTCALGIGDLIIIIVMIKTNHDIQMLNQRPQIFLSFTFHTLGLWKSVMTKLPESTLCREFFPNNFLANTL